MVLKMIYWWKFHVHLKRMHILKLFIYYHTVNCITIMWALLAFFIVLFVHLFSALSKSIIIIMIFFLFLWLAQFQFVHFQNSSIPVSFQAHNTCTWFASWCHEIRIHNQTLSQTPIKCCLKTCRAYIWEVFSPLMACLTSSVDVRLLIWSLTLQFKQKPLSVLYLYSTSFCCSWKIVPR